MATLSTFHQRVSRAIRRGKVYDGDIPAFAKDAVRTLEDLENWKHMWVEDSDVLTSASNVITLERVKSVRYIRLHVSDATHYKYLEKISPDQVTYVDTGRTPDGFYMSGRDEITMDAFVSDDTDYDIGYYQYSEYNSDLVWLDIAENLLIAQTMVEMAPLLKDDRSKARWTEAVSNRVAILVDAGLVHEFDGQRNEMIPYADEIDDWLLTGARTD